MNVEDIRYYPPEWCSAATMAYLLDLGESTFRSYVTRRLLPAGVHRGGSVRWHRETTLDAWGAVPTAKAATPRAANDNEEDLSQQIIASIRRHGATKKARG
jgi:6-phosphogluconate dehydrogenase (decarboxylating)